MLGNRIRELRIACGWNQVELSKKLNISKQTVSNWENDNIQPSIEMLTKLADVFLVSTDYLLGREHIPRLSIDGLPASIVAHISMLIDDYRNLSASSDVP